jgi:chromate transporter
MTMPGDADAAAEPTLPTPTNTRELFFAFNRLSLQGFGGVLPVAQRELVERRRWLSKADFLELLSAGQVLPGPNIVNLGLLFGDRCLGWRGALAAMAGLIAAPLLIVVTLAALYGQFVDVPAVAGALRGMAAVSAGLILATAVKLAPSLRGNVLGRLGVTVVAAATFAAASWWRVPLVVIVCVLGGGSVAWAAWKLRP